VMKAFRRGCDSRIRLSDSWASSTAETSRARSRRPASVIVSNLGNQWPKSFEQVIQQRRNRLDISLRDIEVHLLRDYYPVSDHHARCSAAFNFAAVNGA